MNTQDLIIPALIGLPVAGAYFLAFIVASVINGGRSWPLWLLLLVVCCVLWGLAYSETQRNMSVVEPSREAYAVWTAAERHSRRPERPPRQWGAAAAPLLGSVIKLPRPLRGLSLLCYKTINPPLS